MRAAACRLGMAALDRVTYSACKPPQSDANAMPEPNAQPAQPTAEPSRLRRAWRWMRATGTAQ
jgi:hypothetical protein